MTVHCGQTFTATPAAGQRLSPLSGQIFRVKQDVALCQEKVRREGLRKEMARDWLRLEKTSGVYLIQALLRPRPATVTSVLKSLFNHLLSITKDGRLHCLSQQPVPVSKHSMNMSFLKINPKFPCSNPCPLLPLYASNSILSSSSIQPPLRCLKDSSLPFSASG